MTKALPDLFDAKIISRDNQPTATTSMMSEGSLWLALGRGVFGLMTLIREITHGLDIIARPHLPQ